MTQSLEGGAPRHRFPLLLACFFLSGLAGLIYQTAWTQQFALVFGTSELALVTVLTAYMAGLALGAAAAGRFAYRLRRPVLTYALLELGIGLAALAVQPAIDLASRLHVALFGGSDLPPEAGAPASALFTFLSSGAILLVPTALMGATLPLLARWAIHREAQIGPRIGALYTANTAGAAAGALVGAFVLLPRFGLGFTVLAGAAVNGLVFALAAVLARGLADGTTEPQDRGSRRWHWILPLILVSGIVSFTWEVLWTRLLTQLVGGSLYAFATMLATFLVGLALGSAWAARAARDAARARTGFIVAQLAIAGLSLAAFALADRLPQLAGRPGGRLELLLYGAVASAATLLPAAVAIGATFPFAVRILAARAEDAAAASARVFAWNTVGAITGAVAAGYLLLPTLGFAGTAQAAAAASLFLALAAALLTQPRRPTLIATAACGLLALLLLRPGNPWTLLRHSPLRTGAVPGEIVGLGVGRSATVLTLERRDGWRIASNGLPEASIEPPWGRPSRDLVTRWLSLLPLLVRPQTSSLLVVGLGAGVTVEDVPASVESIHVVELESEVVRANRQLAAQRWRDPLADPRLSLHTNDARGALRLTGRRFDAIVSQPSHPWTSGASHLFTREF
ncbi:MAG: fused MFS/spermidine synthase, partial [Acidobacteriota bacterium]